LVYTYLNAFRETIYNTTLTQNESYKPRNVNSAPTFLIERRGSFLCLFKYSLTFVFASFVFHTIFDKIKHMLTPLFNILHT